MCKLLTSGTCQKAIESAKAADARRCAEVVRGILPAAAKASMASWTPADTPGSGSSSNAEPASMDEDNTASFRGARDNSDLPCTRFRAIPSSCSRVSKAPSLALSPTTCHNFLCWSFVSQQMPQSNHERNICKHIPSPPALPKDNSLEHLAWPSILQVAWYPLSTFDKYRGVSHEETPKGMVPS